MKEGRRESFEAEAGSDRGLMEKENCERDSIATSASDNIPSSDL